MSQTGHNYKINFRSKQKDLKQTQWHSVLNWDHKLRPARDPFVFMGFQSLSVGVVYTSGSHSHSSLLLQTSWQAAVKHRAVSLAVHHTLTTYLSTNHQLIMTSYLVLDKFLYRNRTEMDTMLTMVNVGICIHRGTWRLRFHHFDFDTERYTGGKWFSMQLPNIDRRWEQLGVLTGFLHYQFPSTISVIIHISRSHSSALQDEVEEVEGTQRGTPRIV